MARKSVRGVCKLCRKRRILCKSHYLGRALYALSRVNGENPVVMTPQLVTLSPRQMWAHLLCRECEERFCKCGEKPVMQLLNGKDQFPLLNRMQLALAVKKDGNAVTFSGAAMGIDTTPLAYFALSLVWRGAVHKWKTLKGQTTFVELGEYEEPIRRYLLGQAGFPDGVYVLVAACEDLGSQVTSYPPAKVTGGQYRHISLLTRGIWFVHRYAGKEFGRTLLCPIRTKGAPSH